MAEAVVPRLVGMKHEGKHSQACRGMAAVRVFHMGGSGWRQYLLEDYSGQKFPQRLTHPTAHSFSGH